jgi:hypothetical protein
VQFRVAVERRTTIWAWATAIRTEPSELSKERNGSRWLFSV